MFGSIDLRFKYYLGFIYSLFRYDIFISYNGFLWKTILARTEPLFFKISKKKIVVIPFGGDAYIYNRVCSSTLLHGLNISLPRASKRQEEITKRVELWNKSADVIIPGVMGFDGLGRGMYWFPVFCA